MPILTRLAVFASILAMLSTIAGTSHASNPNVDWIWSVQPHAHPGLRAGAIPELAPQTRQLKKKSKQVSKRRIKGLTPRLSQLLRKVESHFGRRVHITSGCRSKAHNHRVGGARKSLHLKCMAADIKVAKVSKEKLKRFLRTLPNHGGIGTYCNKSIVHIDVGPRRSWHYGCKKRRHYARKSKKRLASLTRRKKKKTRR